MIFKLDKALFELSNILELEAKLRLISPSISSFAIANKVNSLLLILVKSPLLAFVKEISLISKLVISSENVKVNKIFLLELFKVLL